MDIDQFLTEFTNDILDMTLVDCVWLIYPPDVVVPPVVVVPVTEVLEPVMTPPTTDAAVVVPVTLVEVPVITPPTTDAAVVVPVTLVEVPVITPPTTDAAVTRPVTLTLAPVLTLPVPFGVKTIFPLAAVVCMVSSAVSVIAPDNIKLPPVMLPVDTVKLVPVKAAPVTAPVALTIPETNTPVLVTVAMDTALLCNTKLPVRSPVWTKLVVVEVPADILLICSL